MNNGHLVKASQEEIQTALEKFKSIPKDDKVALMDALDSVCRSSHATQPIFIKFYEALPVDMQTGLREQIYLARPNGTTVIGGEDRWVNYGQYMIYHQFSNPTLNYAVRKYKEIVAVPSNVGVVMGSDQQNRRG